MKRKLLLYLCLATLTQCSKCKNDPAPADPASQLPPATQTGANTFGCLVDGKPYTPKGSTGTSNFNVMYDPVLNGGDLIIAADRIEGSRQWYITILAAPVTTIGKLSFSRPNGACKALYADTPAPSACNLIYSDRDVSYRSGQLEITRFDTRARIVSGTFNFKLLQAGCDTLRITQGRFDAKF